VGEQHLPHAQDFFAKSLGRIKGRMQSDSAQLETLMQQFPEDARAQIQEMTDSYTQFGDIIDQATQDAGVQEEMEEEAQGARRAADEALGQGQEPVEQAADQMQEMAGNPGPD
jgi:methyl-accepting chemotaxis protein